VSIEPSSRPRTFIIADDLTGACDAAVAFSSRGLSTEVLLDANHPGSANVEVCGICTGTRETAVDRAVGTVHRVAQQQNLKHYDQIFKKVDSTFRGNTFHEIHAAFDAFYDYFVVVAPAYPALGRISVDGVLKVRDVTGETSIAVRDGLQATGLRPYWIAAGQPASQIEQRMLQSLKDGNRLVFCDAVTDEDLQATVRAARAMQKPILWIGSAGLAHALAANLPAQPSRVHRHRKGFLLIFVGSNHPVTQRQITDLHEQNGVPIWSSDIVDGTPPENAAILFRIERGRTTEDEIRIAVARFTPQLVSCLFMTGGDTAMLVCRALGIHSLRLHEEFEPGLPQATSTGGNFAGCTIILKSGGFGQTDVLSRIAKHFSQEKVATL
jgi:D-threonate/D-erythronate kinase